jgi:hypothetical protein
LFGEFGSWKEVKTTEFSEAAHKDLVKKYVDEGMKPEDAKRKATAYFAEAAEKASK